MNVVRVCLQEQQDIRRSHYRAIMVPVLLRSRKALQLPGADGIFERRQLAVRNGFRG